jgi:Protein of unknown function (DUF2934)
MAKKKPAEGKIKRPGSATRHEDKTTTRRRPIGELDEAEFRGRVARKAYELFERRGGELGHDLEDWLTAERLVLEEMER